MRAAQPGKGRNRDTCRQGLHRPASPEISLFETNRVEEVEATDEWKAWEDCYRGRGAAGGRRTAETDEAEPKTGLGRGRNGYYPVLRM